MTLKVQLYLRRRKYSQFFNKEPDYEFELAVDTGMMNHMEHSMKMEGMKKILGSIMEIQPLSKLKSGKWVLMGLPIVIAAKLCLEGWPPKFEKIHTIR